MLKSGTRERWIVTNPDLRIKDEAKLFAPALKSSYGNPNYLKMFEEYCLKGFSIRYSGCFAVDVYQIFVKGQGFYCKLDSIAHPSNLHLIYELIPLAFLVEKAGGESSDGQNSVLEKVIQGFGQRISFIAGSKKDVQYVAQ